MGPLGRSWLAGPFHAWCRRDVERCCPVSSPLAGCPRAGVGRPSPGPSRQVSTLVCNLRVEYPRVVPVQCRGDVGSLGPCGTRPSSGGKEPARGPVG